MNEVSSCPNLLGDVPRAEKFTSKRHASESLGKMKSYFMTEELTDVVLIAGERRIPAHRLVLSAASDYFATMFRSKLMEASQTEITMHDVDGDVLHALIKYCYTGEIEFVTDTAQALLYTACLLQLNEVVEACCGFFEKQLDPSNCIGIKHFADSLSLTKLREASQSYTTKHFTEVIQNQEFLKLSADEVAELLDSDALNIFSEDVVFRGLISWIEIDLSNRREHLSRLLEFIRFPLLSPSFLVDHVATNTLIRDLPEFGNILMENYKYRLLPERLMLQSKRTRPRNYTDGILVLGGYDQSGTYVPSARKYNTKLQGWTELDKINFFAPSRGGITESNGKLYVCGGQRNGSGLNEVLCVDMKTKTCTTLPPMLTSRWGLRVGVLNGHLYAVGGQNQSGVLQTVERFDFFKQQWSYVRSMYQERSGFGLAVLDGKLYAVGGHHHNLCFGPVTVTTAECYDPFTDDWTSLPSMRTDRGEPGVGVLNGLLYAVGGVNSNGVYTSSVERYDPKKNTWSQVASMKYARKGVSVCVMGEKLLAVGGCNKRSAFDVMPTIVEAYNLRENVWVEVGSLNDGRSSTESSNIVKAVRRRH